MQFLESVVLGEETTIHCTCVAALYSEKAAVRGSLTEEEERKMKKAHKDVLSHYNHQLEQNLNTNARGPRRSIIRMMFYYLHSSRVKATDMQLLVSDENLREAESCAEYFKRELLNDCPMRDKALFCSALGDLFARKGEYEEGLYCY